MTVDGDGTATAGSDGPESVGSGGATTAGDEPTNAGADDSGSDDVGRTELSLAYATEPLSLDEFDVKLRETRRLLGVECAFYVIGSSHYVAAPALDLYELLSCRDLDEQRTTRVPLADADGTHEVSFASDAVVVDTRIEARPLSAYPDPSTCDLAYRFGPDAYTTIDCRSDGYDTYHTYPEHELALYTTSTLERVDGAAAASGAAVSEVETSTAETSDAEADHRSEADRTRSIDCD